MWKLQNLKTSFLNLVYPPECLHCSEALFEEPFLCKNCLELLEFIDISLHCPKCFSLKYSKLKHRCDNCFSKKSYLTEIAATFDYRGPIATLIKKFKYENKPYLAEGLVGYMAVQLIDLKWPIPDLIVPVPQSLSHFFMRGYNQAELLAESLSLILNCPVQKALTRTSDDYSQAGLNYEQRLNFSGNSISLKKNQQLQDKNILLVDDVLTTGMTLQRCAESLLEGCPNSIYAITTCYAGN